MMRLFAKIVNITFILLNSLVYLSILRKIKLCIKPVCKCNYKRPLYAPVWYG